MKRIFLILAMVLVAASSVLTSCGGESEKKSGKATAKILSGPYELLIVAHKSWLGEGDGIEFRKMVDCPVLGLNQPEPNFRVTTLEPRDYKGKYIMYGNILKAEIGSEYEKPEMKVEYDVNAQPQIIITVQGPTSSSIMIYLENKKDSLLNLFINHELQREKKLLVKNHSAKVLKSAEKMFGTTLYAPTDVDEVFEKDNFFRATSTKRFQVLNVCMYSYPFTSMDDFNLESFIQKRDSAMGKWIYADTEDQKMMTETRCVFDEKSSLDGRFVYKVRGLWLYNKAPFGGTFVSYSFVNEKKNEVVVAEGFVWAPEEKKRNLMRELEASLMTLKFK